MLLVGDLEGRPIDELPTESGMAHLIENTCFTDIHSEKSPENPAQQFAIKQTGGVRRHKGETAVIDRREPLVFIVEDQPRFSPGLQTICEFLGITLEQVSSSHDLTPLLKIRKPMAVFCEFDSQGQDGCHIMKVVADHDRTLPVLVVVGDDPNLLGAAEAVEEIFHLTEIRACKRLPGVGELVEFLFSAGRRGRCLSLMPS
jgi:hypothetical protein